MPPSLLYTAWKRMMLAFLISFAASLATGILLLNWFDIEAETVFEISTQRLSYAVPLMEMGAEAGMDGGLILFVWNAFGALATLSFIYTAAMFNPLDVDRSPKLIRKFFCSRTPMKLLCFLPGCLRIREEALRRLYIWLMVPFIGMILLGIETGLSVSTSKQLFGSYLTGIICLIPHGIVEIPAFALAGAVAFSAHLMIRPMAPDGRVADVFQDLEAYRKQLKIKRVALSVLCGLLVAGLVEAHVSRMLLDGT